MAERDDRNGRSIPRIPIREPSDRHFISRLRGDSPSKQITTLIEPGIDVRGDVLAIRQGRAVRDGERYTVNGRTWQVKPNGTLFPVEGEGFVGLVNQDVMLAMKAFARYNGVNEQSEYFLDRQGVGEDARATARRIWKLRENTDGQGTS